MKIAIVGTGYVGLPTGVGLAEFGNEVICVDKIAAKIEALNNGQLTIYEDGLEELFQKAVRSGKLRFTTDMKEAVAGADVVMLAVGTPPHPVTKEADLQYIYAAAQEAAQYLDGYTVLATKSTVPVGTGDEVEAIVRRVNPGQTATLFRCRNFCAKVLPFMTFLILTGLLSALTAKEPERSCGSFISRLKARRSFCWSAGSRLRRLNTLPMPFWQ